MSFKCQDACIISVDKSVIIFFNKNSPYLNACTAIFKSRNLFNSEFNLHYYHYIEQVTVIT